MRTIYNKLLIFSFDVYTWLVELWNVRVWKLDLRVIAKNRGSASLPLDATRVAIVALFPSQASLPFTLNLLKGLQSQGFFIIAVSDRRVPSSLRAALEDNCHQLMERAGVGADFASYNVGLRWLLSDKKRFDALETLIIANDSLFYPRNIKETIAGMLNCGAPWQCLFRGFEFGPHAQSYFLFFRKEVFSSNAFRDFWKRYRGKTARKHRVMHGEITLSAKLAGSGFGIHAYYSPSDLVRSLAEPPHPLDLLELASRSPISSNSPVAREEIFRAAASILAESEGRSDDEKNEILVLSLRKFAYMIGHHCEMGNPTHVAGLLMNNLLGAPLKRDLCFRGAYDIFQVLRFAAGYDETEHTAMHADLSARALPVSSRGLRRLLIDNGRI